MNELFKEEELYLQSMTEKERKAYEVAKTHLGTLFTLCKTAGFLQWKKKQESTLLPLK